MMLTGSGGAALRSFRGGGVLAPGVYELRESGT